MNSKKFSTLFILIGIIIITGTIICSNIKFKNFNTISHKNELIIPIDLKGFTFDSTKTSLTANNGFLNFIFSRLIKPKGNFDIEGDILEKWSFDRSSNIYYFKIKKNIFFHNEIPLNSDHVINSIHLWTMKDSLDNNLLRAINGFNEWKNSINNHITGIKKIDNLNISVQLKYYDSNFITNLSNPRFIVYQINSKNDVLKNNYNNKIGTGPFIVKSINNQNIELVKNKMYHDGKVLLNKITMPNIKQKDLQGILSSNKPDLILFHNTRELNLNSYYSKDQIRSYKKMVLIFNPLHNKIFKNKDYRSFVSSTLNDTNILKLCFPWFQKTQNIIPKGMLGHTKITKKNIFKNLKIATYPKTTIYMEEIDGSKCYTEKINKKLKNINIEIKTDSFLNLVKLFKKKKISAWFEVLSFKNEDPMAILQYFNTESPEYLLGEKFYELQDFYKNLYKDVTDEFRFKSYTKIENYLIKNSLVVPFLDVNDFIIRKKELALPEVFGARYFIHEIHNLGRKNE